MPEHAVLLGCSGCGRLFAWPGPIGTKLRFRDGPPWHCQRCARERLAHLNLESNTPLGFDGGRDG